MAGTLTVSSKLSPFPYGAIAIATYTQKADLVFDETASGISLDLNGSNINTEQEIVHALAKAGGLSDDSSKVSARSIGQPASLNLMTAVPGNVCSRWIITQSYRDP